MHYNFYLSGKLVWSGFERRWEKWIVIINMAFERFFFFGKRNRKAEGLPDEDEVYLFSKMRDITASSFA